MNKILLVDDNSSFLDIFSRLIKKSGYEVSVATSAVEGIAIAENEDLDLIIVDIRMPHIDGFEMLDQLKKNPSTACIPTIAHSAGNPVQDREMALEVGFDEYVAKPFEVAQLLPIVSNLVNRAQMAVSMGAS